LRLRLSFFPVLAYSARFHYHLRVGTHKRRDKRCHIAGPLLRHALLTCFDKHQIAYDQTGSSLAQPLHSALEELQGTDDEREATASQQISDIPGVHGGEGGEVGVFNINHLGGHRYAGVLIVSLGFSDDYRC